MTTLMIEQHISFRTFIKSVLAQRCSKNPSYSLRAFAKQLSMSPSHLSRVLNGTKMISPSTAYKIASNLDLKNDQVEHFMDLVQLERSSEGSKELILQRLEKRSRTENKRTLDLEMFKVLSDWYYLPLVELIKTKNFKSEPKWIAHRLGISHAEVNEALDRLNRLGIVTVEDGKIVSVESEFLITSQDIASAAIKKHHEQMIGLSITALKDQGIEERDFQGLNFIFDPEKVPAAKKALRKFVDKFNMEFGRTGEEVYQLNIQFFKLTKKVGGK